MCESMKKSLFSNKSKIPACPGRQD